MESSDLNPRGEDLLVHCVSADLNFCKVGNNPIFTTKTREEVLELTFVNRCAWDQAVDWHVSNVLSFSDHMYISRGGVEDTRLEAKDTIKIRGQGQPYRGQTLSRPKTEMLEAKDTSTSALQKKKVFRKNFQAISKKKVFRKKF